jgi:hypothetical protein
MPNSFNRLTRKQDMTAFVLNNGFQWLRLCFFTDGEKSLKNALLKAFSWHPAIFVILDWYHIEEKCAEYLSMALTQGAGPSQ